MTSLDVAKIKNEYGSLKAWAARLEVPYTTAHAWLLTGKVPAWRQDKIVEAAEQDGKDIFAKPPKRTRRAAA
jgi:predicted site-specific integrase-resolvase